jgi:hypothetical protein
MRNGKTLRRYRHRALHRVMKVRKYGWPITDRHHQDARKNGPGGGAPSFWVEKGVGFQKVPQRRAMSPKKGPVNRG